MKTENKIELLLRKSIVNFSNDELNLLFEHCFNMYVFTDNDFNRYLCLDDDTTILLMPELTLFFYFNKAKVYYKNIIEIQAQNELKKQINNLIKI